MDKPSQKKKLERKMEDLNFYEYELYNEWKLRNILKILQHK
jgi:hypothetical protein